MHISQHPSQLLFSRRTRLPLDPTETPASKILLGSRMDILQQQNLGFLHGKRLSGRL
jgi:hypothetical protein